MAPWIVLVICSLCLIPQDVSSQSCVTIGCCPGRDDDCNTGGCFCDEACFTQFDDCCSDYLALCTGVGEQVSVFPRFGTMLGGTRVMVFGTFPVTSDITCKFGDSTEVLAQAVSANRAVCISPTYFDVGRVELIVRIDNSLLRSNFLYFAVDQIDDGVTRINRQQWSFGQGPFEITWDSNIFLDTSTVDVEIWNYKEIDPGQPIFIRVLTIGVGVPNIGSYNFSTSRPIQLLDAAVIRVIERAPSGVTRPLAFLWSDVHVATNYLSTFNGAPQFCFPWSISEMNIDFLDVTQACPCTLEAARIDSCRFSPDPFCDINNNDPLNCYRKPGAVHCVRSRFPSTAGGGQECCYNQAGQILNIMDSDGGGFAHRVHHTSMVPFFTNFLVDIIPWFHCCHLANINVACLLFRSKRPSQSCSGYIGPRIVWVGGDPHFLSLDGLSYTFNGLGEFLFVDIGQFVAHVRTSVVSNDVSATMITAIAATHSESDIFHMELLDTGETEIRILIDNGNGNIGVVFDTNGHWMGNGIEISQDFDEGKSVVVAQFPGAIALRVVADQGMLVVRLLLPGALITLPTKGFLGVWNGNTDDDLTDSNGVIQPDTAEGILRFGNSWNVSTEEALFYRPPGATPPFFFPDFIPTFVPVNVNVSPQQLEETCAGHPFCEFDFLATGNQDVAEVTMNAVTTFEEDVVEIQMNEENCPLLEETESLKVIVTGSMVGQTATYFCVDGFTLIGDAVTVCMLNPLSGVAVWSNLPPTCQLNLVPPVSTCPNGWTYSLGECYRVFSDSDSQFTADYGGRIQSCKSFQGNLAILEPYNSYLGLLNQLIPSTSAQLFAIGLDDIAVDDVFRWLDGTIPTQTAWSSGQPAVGDNNEDCVFIRATDHLWEDGPCNTAAQFICQRHASRDNTVCGSNAQSSIGYMLGSPSDPRRCVATLINAKWAVTSATCGWADRVVFGSTDYSDNPLPPAQVREFIFFIHPLFDSFAKRYDIALLMLDEPISFNPLVNPMCVHTSETSTNCASSSWGVFQNDIPTTIETNVFTSVLNEVCSSVIDPFASSDVGIKDCIANQDTGEFVPCEQDAGAPFHCLDPQIRQTLVSVTAQGICSNSLFHRLEIGTKINTNRFLAFVTEGDFFDCKGNGIVFKSQICNQRCDCPSNDDEIDCAAPPFGSIFTINSPKFGIGLTSFVDRCWLFRRQTSQVVVTITNFTLDVLSGFVMVGTGTDPSNQGTIVNIITTTTGPITLTSEYVWISYHKESLSTAEGFEATVLIQ